MNKPLPPGTYNAVLLDAKEDGKGLSLSFQLATLNGLVGKSFIARLKRPPLEPVSFPGEAPYIGQRRAEALVWLKNHPLWANHYRRKNAPQEADRAFESSTLGAPNPNRADQSTAWD